MDDSILPHFDLINGFYILKLCLCLHSLGIGKQVLKTALDLKTNFNKTRLFTYGHETCLHNLRLNQSSLPCEYLHDNAPKSWFLIYYAFVSSNFLSVTVASYSSCLWEKKATTIAPRCIKRKARLHFSWSEGDWKWRIKRDSPRSEESTTWEHCEAAFKSKLKGTLLVKGVLYDRIIFYTELCF